MSFFKHVQLHKYDLTDKGVSQACKDEIIADMGDAYVHLTDKQLNILADAMREEFKKRRDVVVEGLQVIPGIICPKPEGAFYAFPSIKGTGLSSMEFETKALEEAGVAVLSGSAFGDYGEGYMRLSYANSVENLQKAMYRLNMMVNNL